MSLPIVGAKFRPPALAILKVLPASCPLEARPEPENQFDSNAIAVWVKTSDIPHTAYDELKVHASGYGWDVDDIMAASEWHLGYIPAKVAVLLAPRMAGESAFGTLVLSGTQSKISLPIGEEFAALA